MTCFNMQPSLNTYVCKLSNYAINRNVSQLELYFGEPSMIVCMEQYCIDIFTLTCHTMNMLIALAKSSEGSSI